MLYPCSYNPESLNGRLSSVSGATDIKRKVAESVSQKLLLTDKHRLTVRSSCPLAPNAASSMALKTPAPLLHKGCCYYKLLELVSNSLVELVAITYNKMGGA